MKNLLISFTATLLVGGAVLGFLNTKTTSVYTPRTDKNSYDAKGMQDWLWQRRANLKTGKMDYEYIAKMDKEMAMYNSKKATNDFMLDWIEMGPDKVGGRTRSILIDKNNTNIIYAGAVSGGLWKSTDGGGSWKNVNVDANNLVISSIVQASNGDIYYGTGEQNGTSFRGEGIWKSSDNGATFTQLSATIGFRYVNKMLVDNSDNIYAATNNGLYRTEDGGTTWVSVLSSNTYDVKKGADGTIYAAAGGKVFKSATGESGSFTELTGYTNSNVGRIIIAPAPSNPNYIYLSIAYYTTNNPFGSSYNDFEIYRSTDKGETWTSIRGAYVESFQPFKHQALYDNIIAVYPDDENKILLGGIELYTWNSTSTAWEKISTWIGTQEINYVSVYMHADLHEIVFDPNYSSNKRIYFGNDGGVFVSNNGATTYTSLNLKYNVTQFYNIGCGPEGEIIAGSQDNGTQYNDLQGVNKQRTTQVLGGDGFSSDVSKLNNDIKFGSLYYGEIDRIVGEGDVQQMNPQNSANPFVTDFELWESYNDPYSIDSIYYTFSSDDFLFDDVKDIEYVYDVDGNVVDSTIIYWVPGDTIIGRSACGLKPIQLILSDNDLNNGDTIFRREDVVKIHDTYQAALAVGLDEGLKVTSLPVSLALSEKFRFINLVRKADVGGIAENIAWTSDGDIIYFSVGTKVYRLSNILAARELSYIAIMRKNATIYNPDIVQLQYIGNFSNHVTSIAVDPNVANNIIVTTGSYDVGSHIYFSTNAAVTNTESTSTNFTSVQGSLPEVPAFSSLISWNDSRKVVVGTEYGIYSTDDITASPVQWVLQNSGLPKVATYSLVQQRFPNSWEHKIFNHGYIYAGTYGRGAFRSESNAGPVDVPEINTNNNVSSISNINVYPNPVSSVGNISMVLKKTSKVDISIYSLSGQLVYSKTYNGINGENNFKFSVDAFAKGAYFIKIKNNNSIETKKIIVR